MRDALRVGTVHPTRVGTTAPAPVMPNSVLRFTPTRVGTTQDGVPVHRRGDGSPPHAWGRRRRKIGSGCDGRFTPTCVGTTGSGIRLRELLGSPPRAWGRRKASVAGGPSSAVHPHARGDDSADRIFGAQSRFTPTRVGTTSGRRTRSTCAFSRFTPTRVGDDHVGLIPPQPNSGSPPRAWGTHPEHRRQLLRAGSPPRAWGPRDGTDLAR